MFQSDIDLQQLAISIDMTARMNRTKIFNRYINIMLSITSIHRLETIQAPYQETNP